MLTGDEYTWAYFLALAADIVGVLPHGIVQWLLVELGGGGGDGTALHLVLVLQSQETLPLGVIEEGCDWVQDLLQGGVSDGRVLERGRERSDECAGR